MPNAEMIISRSIPAIPDSYDSKKRCIRGCIATDAPVRIFDPERWEPVNEYLLQDGMECPDQVPLLDSHMRYSIDDQRGSVREFTRADGSTNAMIYFDDTQGGKDAELKVAGGHLRDLSAGYEWVETYFIPEGQSKTIGTRSFDGPCRVTPRSRLREVSLTPIGADQRTKMRSAAGMIDEETKKALIARGLPADATDAQIGQFIREEISRQNPSSQGKGTDMPELTQADVTAAQTAATTVERERISHINAMAQRFAPTLKPDATYRDMEALRSDGIAKGWSKEQFNDEVLKRLEGVRPATPANTDQDGGGSIGMNQRDLSRYSIVRGIRMLSQEKRLDGLEAEVDQEVAKMCGRGALSGIGFRIPSDVLLGKRALTGADATKGGFTVGTEVLGSSLIELLRNATMVAQLGARQLSGLTGNIAIPRQSGGATAYWLSSNGTATASDQTFAQLGLTPHRLVAATSYDKELINQSSISIEAFVREDIMRVMAIEKDRASIFGKGAAGEPQGLVNVTGINSVTFGAAATWAKAVEFETKVAQGNALLGSLAYLTSPAVRGKWKTAAKVSNFPSFLWEGGSTPGSGSVNTYRAEVTNQIQSTGTYADRVIFGNWGDMILADWAGVDVVVNPYTLSLNGQIQVVITLWTDMGIRHSVSFALSADSGAQ